MRRQLAVFGLVLLPLLAGSSGAAAHVGHVILSAERYLKLDVSGHDVRVVVSLTLGPAEGRRVLEAADSSGDADVSAAESETYLAAWAEGLQGELPLSLDGEALELTWAEGYFEPNGPVRQAAVTVEMVARFELSGGDQTVRLIDSMVRREVFDRTDVAFQIRGDAELVSSGVEGQIDGPTPEFSYPGTFQEGEDVVLLATLRTPERELDAQTEAWPAGIAAVLLVVLGAGAVAWRRGRG